MDPDKEERTDIYKDLNRSKGWYKSQSKAPKNPGKKTRDEI